MHKERKKERKKRKKSNKSPRLFRLPAIAIKPLFSCWFVFVYQFHNSSKITLTFYCGKWRPPHLLHRVIMNNMENALVAIQHDTFFICIKLFILHFISAWHGFTFIQDYPFFLAMVMLYYIDMQRSICPVLTIFLGNFILLSPFFYGVDVIYNLIFERLSKTPYTIIF